jgi:hypothetical protein
MAIRLRRKSKFRQPFDILTAILFKIIQALTFLFVIAAIFMNPVAKTGIINPKADYLITVSWPDNDPNDIDTYVEDPAGDILNFTNKDVGLMHLDRDDRGNLNDTIVVDGKTIHNPLNQEVTTIRGIVPGEYVVNINYYATQNNKPVPVSISVDKVNPVLEVVYYGTVTLQKKGDEKTVVRFTINHDGTVSNVNHIPKSLVDKVFKNG